MKSLTLIALTVLLTACATINGKADSLKPTLESYYSRLRWKDYRGAAELLVPEKRDAFEKARKKLNDEKDLNISDFQLEDAVVAPDEMSARAVAKLSWFRLPSVTEQSATITTVLVYRGGGWLVASMDEGPFAAELAPSPGGPTGVASPDAGRPIGF